MKKKTYLIVIMVIFTISLCGCEENETTLQKTDETVETSVSEYNTAFEKYTKYIGKSYTELPPDYKNLATDGDLLFFYSNGEVAFDNADEDIEFIAVNETVTEISHEPYAGEIILMHWYVGCESNSELQIRANEMLNKLKATYGNYDLSENEGDDTVVYTWENTNGLKIEFKTYENDEFSYYNIEWMENDLEMGLF